MGIQRTIALFLASAAFAPYVAAQENATLEPVTIEGSSSGTPGVVIYGGGSLGGGSNPCGRGTGNGGGGACSGGGGGEPGNPRPKTTQQIEAEKKRCDGSYTRDTTALAAEINARYTACANSATSSVGTIIDRILGQSSAQACITVISDLQKKKQWDIDLSRAECYAKAEKP